MRAITIRLEDELARVSGSIQARSSAFPCASDSATAEAKTFVAKGNCKASSSISKGMRPTSRAVRSSLILRGRRSSAPGMRTQIGLLERYPPNLRMLLDSINASIPVVLDPAITAKTSLFASNIVFLSTLLSCWVGLLKHWKLDQLSRCSFTLSRTFAPNHLIDTSQ